MECPDGCISQDACSDNTAYISTVIFLGLYHSVRDNYVILYL